MCLYLIKIAIHVFVSMQKHDFYCMNKSFLKINWGFQKYIFFESPNMYTYTCRLAHTALAHPSKTIFLGFQGAEKLKCM